MDVCAFGHIRNFDYTKKAVNITAVLFLAAQQELFTVEARDAQRAAQRFSPRSSRQSPNY
jgi:hypothetical protein